MSEKTVAEKLLIKSGKSVRFVNAPRGYMTTLGARPKNVTVVKGANRPADIIQVFIKSRAEMEAQLSTLKDALNPDGILWVTYPKGAAKKQKADLNRDSLYAYGKTIGLEGVGLVAVDDEWSAMRFKVLE